ncbi:MULTISPECIES: phage tail protein [Streptomyces]|uniref:Phage tail protein n=1 Tax=Streptomyces luteosporeus TaxID=173856 RepID=A0ABN3U679_9ACTN
MGVGVSPRPDAFVMDLGKNRVAIYQNVDGLQDYIGPKAVPPDGQLLTRKIPGGGQLRDVTLSGPMDASGQWNDWVKRTAASGGPDPTQPDLSISLLDGKEKAVARVNLVNAWASSWEGPALTANDAGTAIETVTLVYEDLTIEK